DRPDSHRAGPIARAGATGLGHSPKLRELDAQRVEELDHLDRRGSRPDVHRGELVEPEHRSEVGEDVLIGPGDLLLELRRNRLASLPKADPFGRCGKRVLDRLSLLLRLAREHRLEAGLELLPDARAGEEPVWMDLREVAHD